MDVEVCRLSFSEHSQEIVEFNRKDTSWPFHGCSDMVHELKSIILWCFSTTEFADNGVSRRGKIYFTLSRPGNFSGNPTGPLVLLRT